MIDLDRNVWGINHQWCRFLLEELIRNGVTTFVASTGSRNTALLMALADFSGIEVLTHYDERGAGFYALGYGRATRRPAALISTSGTAAANYYPAIIEASAADVPLIVITADRPAEVRDARTDQVIDQVNIYGHYLRWRFDFPAPDQGFFGDYLLTAVDQAVYRASASPAGPVHLNVCLRKPHVTPAEEQRVWYKSTPLLERWKDGSAPYTTYAQSPKCLAADSLAAVATLVQGASRGLIVCGGLSASPEIQVIAELGKHLAWPVLADAASGLRFAAEPDSPLPVCAHYELFLRNSDAAAAFKPDVVLHFGGEPVNESVQTFLGASAAEYVLVNAHPFRQDPRRNVTIRIDVDPIDLARQLQQRVAPQPSALLDLFERAERCARRVLAAARDETKNAEWQLVQALCDEIPEGCGLFLGNSLPVREMDRFAPRSAKRLRVTANRGTSGVDGNIACAAGFAAGLVRPATVFIGDVAALHDLNSLALLKKSRFPVTLVIPNNDGGGIFSFLPTITGAPCFQNFFTAPHGMTFEGAAAMYGLPYFSAASTATFRDVYRRALRLGQSSIVEVSTDRDRNVEEQRGLSSRIVEALRSEGVL